jgi:hypothetical protein
MQTLREPLGIVFLDAGLWKINSLRLAAAAVAFSIAACGSGVNVARPPPVANAGPDQAVVSGAAVTLDGAASSDPAGLAFGFAWAQTAGPAVPLSSATAANPSFTAPVVLFGTPASLLVFSLTASSANGSSAASTVTITVNPEPPPNTAPVANAGINQAAATGALVTLDGSASFDPASAPLSFLWTQSSGPAVVLSSLTTARTTFSAPSIAVGQPLVTLTFSLVVSDALASSNASIVTVTVNPPGVVSPAPPGSLPPAPPTTTLVNGGSGSNRFEMGTGLNGLYIRDPAAGEDTVQGIVTVALNSIGGGNGSQLPPTDTTVTLNGVQLLLDPAGNGLEFIIDKTLPQPVVGSGGQLVLIAKATEVTVNNKGVVTRNPIQRQLVLPCPKDVEVSSTPAIGSVITGLASIHVTSPSDLSAANLGVVIAASIVPQVDLFGYDRATRSLVPSGGPINVILEPLDMTVPVTPTAGDAYLFQLEWPGTFIVDGQTGGFCGLQKRWTYAK